MFFCLLLIFMIFFAIVSGVSFFTILFIYNLAFSFILCGGEQCGFPKFIIFFLNVIFIFFVSLFLLLFSMFHNNKPTSIYIYIYIYIYNINYVAEFTFSRFM